MTRFSSCFSSIFLRWPWLHFWPGFVTLSGQYVLITPLFPFVHNCSRLFFFKVSEFWSFDFCGLPCRVCSVFLSCILVTTLRSLIWDSLLIAGDSFFISLSSSTLVAFLTCFLLLSGQYVLITALFHFVHKSSWLFLHYSLWVLKKFSPLSIILESLFCLFVIFSKHYLLITDLKPLLIVNVSFQLLFFIKLLSLRSLDFDLFVESWLVCWCFFDTFSDYFSITDLNLVSDCRWLASIGFYPILLLQITYPCSFDLFDGSCLVCWCFFWCFHSLILIIGLK